MFCIMVMLSIYMDNYLYLTDHKQIVERQNGKRGLESGFGSAGYANGI